MTQTVASVGELADGARSQGRCSMCGSRELTDFFVAKNLPVDTCVLGESRESARQAPRGDVLLAFCHRCGLVHNQWHEPEKVRFEPGYEASLAYSGVFRDFTRSVAERLLDRYQLVDRDIIEVGSGSGFFLRMLCELGGNRGVGFDPSVESEGIEELGQGSIRFVRDFYDQRHGGLPCDFLCCLSVLEAMPSPLTFTRQVRRVLGSRRIDGYFEVFNAFRAFAANETWSVHYEQCNYFGLDSLCRLLTASGFVIHHADEGYGDGQYVYAEVGTTGNELGYASPQLANPLPTPDEVTRFAGRHEERMTYWRAELERCRQLGSRVAFWGTGGKGVSFLNMLDTETVIEYAVDINSRRQGRFVPGAGQEIVTPESMIRYRPDLVIVSNALYKDEIMAQLAEMEVECEVRVA